MRVSGDELLGLKVDGVWKNTASRFLLASVLFVLPKGDSHLFELFFRRPETRRKW
jgi:hypothetical protein